MPGTVTLSRTDYDRLLDLAARRPREPEPAPVPAALTRADVRVRVEGNAARATATLEGQVFHTGVVKVPLVHGATLLDARLADGPLPLVTDGKSHSALLAGPTSFAATLEWASPLEAAPGHASFLLPVPNAGSATAVIDVPGGNPDVRLSRGLIVGRTSAGGRTIVEATLDPGSPVRVSWSVRETSAAAPGRAVRLLSDVKTVLTIGDADVRLFSLVDVTVVTGEPASLDIRLPAAYELASLSGPSVDRTEEKAGVVTVGLASSTQRQHQLAIVLERSHGPGSFRLETELPSVAGSQRETGEIAVEGLGTMEVASPGSAGLRRIDVRETSPVLWRTGRPLLAAYRYQRGPGNPPSLALDVTRFADAAVLAAVAERAVATTLMTSQGRMLTEITLRIRNRAQPFLRVVLPQGATMLSVEVAGQPAPPATAPDGMRVPLLRSGFRPGGPYDVSFVYVHAGPPFAKKGEMEMALPRMDLPIALVEWELFVPDRFRADRFRGDLLPAALTGASGTSEIVALGLTDRNVKYVVGTGTISGRVVDASGAVLPGTTIVAEVAGQRQSVIANANGEYVVSGLPSGAVTITGELAGFRSVQHSLDYDQRSRRLDFAMESSGLTESVTVRAESPRTRDEVIRREDREKIVEQQPVPSLNVQSLQRRVAGVLPVRMDVPRAGTSHRFVRPLVLDEPTAVSFRYRTR
ncbi:MAG TPA: carboxypeptidase-like regulatory domain-containing protein [Vicinamibacterales bacterium]|nr:carboxypeptidase-like regulatory domain-containing protein [Vicinamibacterales bacterium]